MPTSTMTIDPPPLSEVLIDNQLMASFPIEKALFYKIMPLSFEKGLLIVASAEENTFWPEDFLRTHFKEVGEIIFIPATKKELGQLVDFAKEAHLTPQGLISFLAVITSFQEARAQNAIIHLINSFCYEAIQQKTSDLHFDPTADGILVRKRIDGLLHTHYTIPPHLWPHLVGRLKVMAKQDTTITRHPQTGKFRLAYQARFYDMRLATQPTQYGERVTLRILGQYQALDTFENLGFRQKDAAILRKLSSYKEGLIIVCGPTGSGKTTTLQTFLRYSNPQSQNVMTLEQPIEYTIPYVNQTEISEQEGTLTFADGLRSILRHDPDVILVGETRDSDTAQMTLRATMTGHLVFTTLHAPNVSGIFPRLQDLGISIKTMMPYLRAIIAQRLVRRLCTHCKSACTPDEAQKKMLSFKKNTKKIYKAKGCSNCYETGYQGRLVIYELLHAKEDLQLKLLNAEESGDSYQEVIQKSLSSTLESSAIDAVLEGLTSLDEIMEIINPHE